jgi:hypothetical protein
MKREASCSNCIHKKEYTFKRKDETCTRISCQLFRCDKQAYSVCKSHKYVLEKEFEKQPQEG